LHDSPPWSLSTSPFTSTWKVSAGELTQSTMFPPYPPHQPMYFDATRFTYYEIVTPHIDNSKCLRGGVRCRLDHRRQLLLVLSVRVIQSVLATQEVVLTSALMYLYEGVRLIARRYVC
jgi:hypothetical protein